MDDLAAGSIVAGRFEIVRKLGEGGMGAVYQATQLNLRRDVALKVILPEHAVSKGARGRFEREARVASALRHPNAVEIYDFGEYEDTLYLAMEFLNGVTLRAFVDYDKPPLAPRRAIAIGTQIADVLVAASQIPLVHRDLKPENIILDRGADGDERVVVVDFGLAFISEADGDMGRLTREGVVTGTPDYMSPEQARGSVLTTGADIYALGCVMYEMLASVPPFEGDPAILLSRHLFVAPTPLREAHPEIEIPGALDDLLMQMLAKVPEDRPSARKVRDRLIELDLGAPQRMSSVHSDGRMVGRAARMVSLPPISTQGNSADQPAPMTPPNSDVRVGIVGSLDADFQLGLAANGLQCMSFDGDVAGLSAVFAPGLTPERVKEVGALGVPVVTDADPSDVERLSALLRAGAAEVVIKPCQSDDVARKLWRAIRKRARRSK